MDDLTKLLSMKQGNEQGHGLTVNNLKEKLIKSEETYFKMLNETDKQYQHLKADLVDEKEKKEEF